MNIDRGNIEEWLLLYADNELAEKDRKAVESYLEKNPDLRMDLDLILETRLQPQEKLSFIFTKSLLQPVGELNEAAIESILDAIDGETDEIKKAALHKNIQAEPLWQTHYRELQKTRLVPDTGISFPSKHILYRSAGESVRLWSIRYMLRAAAVILIFLSVAGWFRYGRKKEVIVKKELQQPHTNTKYTRKEKPSVAMEATTHAFSEKIQPIQKQNKQSIENEESEEDPGKPILLSRNEEAIPQISDPVKDISENISGTTENTNAYVASSEIQTQKIIDAVDYIAADDLFETANILEEKMQEDSRWTESRSKEKIINKLFNHVRTSVRKKIKKLAGDEPIRFSIVRIRYD